MLSSSILNAINAWLPICWFISFLYILVPELKGLKRRWVSVSVGLICSIAIIIGVFPSFLLSQNWEAIFILSLLGFVYFTWRFFYLGQNKEHSQWLLLSALICLQFPLLMSHITYLYSAFFHLQNQSLVILTGTGVGLLISLALSMTWFLIGVFVLKRSAWLMCLFVLFIAGQLLSIEHWLVQILWGAWLLPVLDLSEWVNQASILGILLYNIFGLHASVSITGLILYSLAISVGVYGCYIHIFSGSKEQI